MKNILLIGVGGTGSKAVDIFFQKKQEFACQAQVFPRQPCGLEHLVL